MRQKLKKRKEKMIKRCANKLNMKFISKWKDAPTWRESILISSVAICLVDFFITKNVDHDILFLSYLSFFWC